MGELRAPLRFEPYLRPMVWGGRALAQLGKRLPTHETYGESWEVSDHPSHRSVLANSVHAGHSLRYLMERHREALLGAAATRCEIFPWLIKFLDAADWLSVQVHPDDKAVKRLWPGEGGKTEAWFIIAAAAESRIYAGLKPGVGPAELRAAIEQGTAADCLHSFTPQPGDCVFLPAGTVHALGGGVVLAEIQQTSDATFRLHDWKRRDAHGNMRQLHIEEALAAIDWKQGPVAPIRPLTPFPSPPGGEGRGGPLVDCPYFHLDFRGPGASIAVGEAMQVLVILSGQATLADEQLLPGQAWLIPADLPRTSVEADSNFSCLHCTLPQH